MIVLKVNANLDTTCMHSWLHHTLLDVMETASVCANTALQHTALQHTAGPYVADKQPGSLKLPFLR